jgi:hypothetical protein
MLMQELGLHWTLSMNFPQFRGLLTATIVGVLTTIALPAAAQPGDGLQSAGGWTTVPSLSLSGSYRTNVYRGSDRSAEDSIDAPVATVEPKLSISSPAGRKFQLEADASVAWEQYFGDRTTTLNQVVDISQESGLNTGVSVKGQVNPEGNISFSLSENFNRLNEPANTPGEESYNWLSNQVGAVVGIHPGARILTTDLGYQWKVYSYSTDSLDALDRQKHQFDLETRWRFLPKTSLVASANYGFVRWADGRGVTVRSGDPEPLVNYSSNPLNVQAGISGLLTNRIAVRATGGYGWSFHEVGPSFKGITGTVAASYSPGRLELENSMKIGYTRDYQVALAGNFVSNHKIFAAYEQKVLDSLLSFNLGTSFLMREYSLNTDLTQTEGGNSLNDEVLLGKAGVAANIRDWWTIDAGYSVRANFTSDQLDIPVGDPDTSSVSVFRDYVQHRVSLGTTVRY